MAKPCSGLAVFPSPALWAHTDDIYGLLWDVGDCRGAQGFERAPGVLVSLLRAEGEAGSSSSSHLQNLGLSLIYKVTVGLEWGGEALYCCLQRNLIGSPPSTR